MPAMDPSSGRSDVPAGRPPAGDRAMAARLAARDESALAEAYRCFGPLVLGVARRVLRDEPLAEDVTQEVFTYLWEHPERFDPSRGTLKAWVGLLAHRRSVDMVRAESRRSRSEARTLEPRAAEPDAQHELQTEWICARVRRALACLSPEQRQALECAYYGGRTYRQVAEELTIPEGTAKSRIRLALARLNDLLRAEIAEEGVPAWT